MAMLHVVRMVQSGLVILVTDIYVNYCIYMRGPEHARMATNCDLWGDLFQLLSSKSDLTLQLKWIPSHLDDPSKARNYPNIDPLYVAANTAADLLVEDKVASLQPPSNIAAPVLYHIGLVKKIQARMVAIMSTFFKYTPKSNNKPTQSWPTSAHLA